MRVLKDIEIINTISSVIQKVKYSAKFNYPLCNKLKTKLRGHKKFLSSNSFISILFTLNSMIPLFLIKILLIIAYSCVPGNINLFIKKKQDCFKSFRVSSL